MVAHSPFCRDRRVRGRRVWWTDIQILKEHYFTCHQPGAQTKHSGMKRIGMKPIATKPIDLKGISYKTYRNYRYRYIKHIAGLNISFTKPIGIKPIAILNISLD
jgi:hypothetical protein